jgi:hypothetical protein
MNEEHPIFEETHAAAQLLEEFQSLTRKTKPAAEDATALFFDKYYLTMSDFLAPIGSVLTRPKHRNENIHDFIASSIHGQKSSARREFKHAPSNGKKLQTIKEFFESLS